MDNFQLSIIHPALALGIVGARLRVVLSVTADKTMKRTAEPRKARPPSCPSRLLYQRSGERPKS